MSREFLLKTVMLCEEVLDFLDTEESRLKFDVDSLRDICTIRRTLLKKTESNGNVSQVDYNAAPIVVETEEKTFKYKNIDDMLARVLTEEDVAKIADRDSDEIHAAVSKLVNVLRKGIDHKFIENKQLLNSYSRERVRHTNPAPIHDSASCFLSQLEEANIQDHLTLAQHDAHLAEALPKYIRAVEQPSDVTINSKDDSDDNLLRDAIQVALNDALLTDVAGVNTSSASQSELIRIASTVQAAVDFTDIKKLICVKINDET